MLATAVHRHGLLCDATLYVLHDLLLVWQPVHAQGMERLACFRTGFACSIENDMTTAWLPYTLRLPRISDTSNCACSGGFEKSRRSGWQLARTPSR